MLITLNKPTFIVLIVYTLFLTTVAMAQSELDVKPTILQSEAPSLRFENLSISDGMKQASATDIIQDSKGFMWIGTQQGLHRYDGHEFKVYQQTPFDTTSISENWIQGIAEGPNGDIWVTTETGGLNRLDQTTGKFTTYNFEPDDSTSLSDNSPERLFFDSRGDLWIGTNPNGLNRMRAGQDGKFDRYTHSEDDSTTISSSRIQFINEDAEGFIWVGTGNGLNRINPETDEISSYLYEPTGIENRGPQNVFIDQYIPPGDTDIFWFATGLGITKFNYKTGDSQTYSIYPVEEGVFNRLNIITRIIPDPENPNILWVGGPGNGIARFDIQTEKFAQYRSDPSDPNSLSDDIIESLFVDEAGTIWVGTSVGGIDLFNPGAVNFTHLRNDPDNDQSLAAGLVWSVFEDSQGTLWVGSNSGFAGNIVTEFDNQTGEIYEYAYDVNDTTTILPGTYRTFIEDQNGEFWMGSSGGLTNFDRTTKKATRFRHPPDDNNVGRNSINAIASTAQDGNIFWIGSFGGLDRFNSITGQFEHIPLPYEELGAEFGPFVFSLFEDEKGTLWAGTNRGLLSLSPDGKVSIESTYNSQDTTGINHVRVVSITQREGEPDVLWLATPNGGLNRFDIKTQTATHYTEDEGLPNNTVYSVLVDKNNTLWMSTNAGISNFDPETETFRNYGLDDGLMALEYNQFAHSKNNDGLIYFGSGLGVTAFVPENLHINEFPPYIAFTDLKIRNKSVSVGPDSPLKESLNETKNIKLSYDQNEISFDYVALHYANSERNRYSYQLKGYDSDWIDAGTRKTASYTNLPEGEYTFNVRAANADGIWNNAGITLGVTILPPWYRTLWAYGMFALLLAGFIYGGDRFQRRRLAVKEQERATLREAELRAEEENKRRADTEQLSKIGRTITSTLSVDEIIHTTYQNVNELMDAGVFGVGILNREKNQLEFPATTEKGKTLKPYSNQLDDDSWLSAWCFNHQEKIVIGDYEKEYSTYIKRILDPICGENPVSIIYLPLVHKGEAIGVLTTQSFSENAYSKYHVTLLQNLANYAAIALDNASAYRRLNKTLEELQAAQTQLVQQEKLASLGQLTAGIAHEIKNPLNFVNNFSDLSEEMIQELIDAMKEGDLNEAEELANDISKNLHKIHEHGSRADSIVKSMLQHSRGGDGKMEPTALNPLIKEYVNLAFHGMKAGENPINVDIDLQFDESIGEVPLVAEDFSRVIVNLTNNAFDAMQGEGHKAQDAGDYEPKLTVRTKSENGSVIIEIEDNGPGIPDDMKDKIMQPFFTTKKGTAGTGLGLSITNDIIKAHGGNMTAANLEESGARFTIKLPAS